MKFRKMALLFLIASGILYGLCTDLAYAGALYIYEMANPSDVGYAGAGLTVRAGDAGTVFTNPAGMTRMKKPTYQAGVQPLYIDANWDSDSSTTATGPDKGVYEIFSGAGFAYVRPVWDKFRLGISVQNYFGLALEWDNKWVGRHEVTKAAIIAPQVQPTIAYQVTNWLSIGAGAGLTMGFLADEAKVKNLDPSLGDGRLKYEDTDFAVQGNFGIMIEPSDKTRIGLRYLTETDLNFSDNVYLTGVGPEIADQVKGDGNLGIDIKMPQSLMAGIFHQFNDQWAFLGSVGWDDWSEFSKVHIRVDGTGLSETVHAGFDDTWHVGLATEYQYSPKWMFTAGFSYDSSMSKGSTRPMELPIGHMYRYGLGVKYSKSDDLLLGAGLSFLWEGDMKTIAAGTGSADNPSGGRVSGEYKDVSITFLSLYAQWR
jgi:long-chain fatty acid transport protein